MTAKRKLLVEDSDETHIVNNPRKRATRDTEEPSENLEDEYDELPADQDEMPNESYSNGSYKSKSRKSKTNRHTPKEVSSSFRKRGRRPLPIVQGIEGQKRFSPRDPRFENLTGILNHDKFLQAYDFLEDRQKSDIDQTRKILKKVKRNRQRKTNEITDNEIDLRDQLSHMTQQSRQRSTFKKTKAILSENRKKDRELVAAGIKQPFYLKASDKKKVLLEERFHDLEKSNRIDKFIEDKRRKNAEKDKRRLPFTVKKLNSDNKRNDG